MATPAHTVQTTPANAGVVTLDEVKRHLNIFSTDKTYDDYLNSLVLAADTHASNIIGQSISTKEYTDYFTGWDSRLVLSATYVDGTPAITYFDDADATKTVATVDYIVDRSAMDKAIVFKKDKTPTAALSKLYGNSISVKYKSTYIKGSQEGSIKQAVLLLIADMFENRESMTMNKSGMSYITAERLLSPYKESKI